MTFRAFNSHTELAEWLKTHDWIYYHAPLDTRPVIVQVRQYTLTNIDPLPKSARVTLWTAETKTFVAYIASHFERFRVKTDAGLCRTSGGVR